MATSAQSWDAARRWQSYGGIKNSGSDWLARFRPYVEDAKGNCGGGAPFVGLVRRKGRYNGTRMARYWSGARVKWEMSD